MKPVLNWVRIFRYAIALFLMQSVVGIVEGLLLSTGSSGIHTPTAASIAASSLSFIACTMLFARLALRQSLQPFTHAWLAFLLQAGVGMLLMYLLRKWIGPVSGAALFLEWLVVTGALVAGTAIGSHRRNAAGRAIRTTSETSS